MRCVAVDEEIQQAADLNVMFEWVSEMGIRTEVVLVPSANLLVRQIASRFQFGDDALRCSFRDPDLDRQVTEADARRFSNQDQDAGMVRKERPRA